MKEAQIQGKFQLSRGRRPLPFATLCKREINQHKKKKKRDITNQPAVSKFERGLLYFF
jgi:hypothetical protein